MIIIPGLCHGCFGDSETISALKVISLQLTLGGDHSLTRIVNAVENGYICPIVLVHSKDSSTGKSSRQGVVMVWPYHISL